MTVLKQGIFNLLWHGTLFFSSLISFTGSCCEFLFALFFLQHYCQFCMYMFILLKFIDLVTAELGHIIMLYSSLAQRGNENQVICYVSVTFESDTDLTELMTDEKKLYKEAMSFSRN